MSNKNPQRQTTIPGCRDEAPPVAHDYGAPTAPLPTPKPAGPEVRLTLPPDISFRGEVLSPDPRKPGGTVLVLGIPHYSPLLYSSVMDVMPSVGEAEFFRVFGSDEHYHIYLAELAKARRTMQTSLTWGWLAQRVKLELG